MLAPLLALLPLLQDPASREVPPPAQELVEATLEELERAFDADELAPRLEALRRATAVPSPEVVERIARAVRERDPEVRTAALAALGGNLHPDALEELHRLYRRDRELREDPAVWVVLLQSIGRHGSETSIDVLADNALGGTGEAPEVQARVLGLANVRSTRSVEALMKIMSSAARHRVQPYMRDLRMALMLLTGVDRGDSQDDWREWWNDHKRGFEVTPEAPLLPPRMQRQWDAYWGRAERYERGSKRARRGDDESGADGR